MRRSKRVVYLSLLFLMAALFACKTDDPVLPDDNGPPDDHAIPDSGDILEIHPRIMLLRGEEDIIRQTIQNNADWRRMHDAIIDESNNIVPLPVLERTMIGRRLLGTSFEALRRIFFLAYSYRMTGDNKYFYRARGEMLNVARFIDWNPSHFLDVGEMTMALAIGYDWLYYQLSAVHREEIQKAILEKGLEPSFISSYNNFTRTNNNWNQVCNAGMTFGALAIYEHYPEISKDVIDRAFNTITLAKEVYNPDGAYPEGYSYWNYGTSFNVLFLSTVDRIWPDRFDYSEHPSFLETGSFLKHMISPLGICFNWGDNNPSARLSPAMFWFADKKSRPSLLWQEKFLLGTGSYSQMTGNRIFPAIMIWGKDISLNDISVPDEKFYVAQGPMPLAVMRTSWTDWRALFLGFKGGSPSVNHGHMDVGSFVFDADGVRWASDLGPQNYNSLESLGLSIWGRTQDAERWTVYRLNNYSHSTLTVDGELQRVSGYARIDRHSAAPDFSFAISDISSVYNTRLASVTRGAGIVDGDYAVIRDELVNNSAPSVVRWQMLTHADVTITGNNTATFTRDGKQLYFRVDEPLGVVITTWSTDPGTYYDAPNPGTVLVGFEVNLPADAGMNLQVKLIPASSGNPGVFSGTLLEW